MRQPQPNQVKVPSTDGGGGGLYVAPVCVCVIGSGVGVLGREVNQQGVVLGQGELSLGQASAVHHDYTGRTDQKVTASFAAGQCR